tara:strand:- start:122 stop:472 length:351 start_codon:yes stop_codon:yes gene_type:complete
MKTTIKIKDTLVRVKQEDGTIGWVPLTDIVSEGMQLISDLIVEVSKEMKTQRTLDKINKTCCADCDETICEEGIPTLEQMETHECDKIKQIKKYFHDKLSVQFNQEDLKFFKEVLK